jgi:hypothetical protein
MSQQDALKRLELLEAAARHVDIRPLAEAAAEKLGFSADELLDEAKRLGRRVEAVGFPALEAELDAEAAALAERCGVSVEQLYGDVNLFFAEHGWKPVGSAAS